MDDFLALGFPTTKLENWKYTNVTPIRRVTFVPALGHPDRSISENLRLQIHSYASPRLVFVNGRLDQGLSTVGALYERPGGPRSASAIARSRKDRPPLQLCSLSRALRDPLRASIVEQHLGRYTSTSENAFAAWNAAFFTEGAFIDVPHGTAFELPVNLVFVSVGGGESWACYPRNLILAGEGSQITFVESFLSVDSAMHLTNAVTEIAASPGAVIDYYKVVRGASQSFHMAAISAHLERDASLTSHSISFGGALVRNDLSVALDGEGSNCTLNGLFTAHGNGLVDNHTRIDHVRSHASSRELYKGVLAGEAEGVFNGAIAVCENARKTDAVRYTKNLLLSKQAQINSKPQLEIRNNDVRCFHGATIGQIDPEAIFYLKSRGIEEGEARRILVRGFAREIIEAIRVPTLRDQLERFLTEWFRLEAS